MPWIATATRHRSRINLLCPTLWDENILDWTEIRVLRSILACVRSVKYGYVITLSPGVRKGWNEWANVWHSYCRLRRGSPEQAWTYSPKCGCNFYLYKHYVEMYINVICNYHTGTQSWTSVREFLSLFLLVKWGLFVNVMFVLWMLVWSLTCCCVESCLWLSPVFERRIANLSVEGSNRELLSSQSQPGLICSSCSYTLWDVFE